MVFLVLTDYQWSIIEPHCLGKKSDPGRSGNDNRLFIEAILWKTRSNSPWRDLPEIFGKWNTVFKRFDDWSRKGIFERIFQALSSEPDMQYAMPNTGIEATIVPVYRHGHGAKGGGHKIKPSANQRWMDN